jgi:hypothetical protein
MAIATIARLFSFAFPSSRSFRRLASNTPKRDGHGRELVLTFDDTTPVTRVTADGARWRDIAADHHRCRTVRRQAGGCRSSRLGQVMHADCIMSFHTAAVQWAITVRPRCHASVPRIMLHRGPDSATSSPRGGIWREEGWGCSLMARACRLEIKNPGLRVT